MTELCLHRIPSETAAKASSSHTLEVDRPCLPASTSSSWVCSHRAKLNNFLQSTRIPSQFTDISAGLEMQPDHSLLSVENVLADNDALELTDSWTTDGGGADQVPACTVTNWLTDSELELEFCGKCISAWTSRARRGCTKLPLLPVLKAVFALVHHKQNAGKWKTLSKVVFN